MQVECSSLKGHGNNPYNLNFSKKNVKRPYKQELAFKKIILVSLCKEIMLPSFNRWVELIWSLLQENAKTSTYLSSFLSLSFKSLDYNLLKIYSIDACWSTFPDHVHTPLSQDFPVLESWLFLYLQSLNIVWLILRHMDPKVKWIWRSANTTFMKYNSASCAVLSVPPPVLESNLRSKFWRLGKNSPGG